MFLGGFDLTPTFREVNKKYSTRYYLSLVLIDEGQTSLFSLFQFPLLVSCNLATRGSKSWLYVLTGSPPTLQPFAEPCHFNDIFPAHRNSAKTSRLTILQMPGGTSNNRRSYYIDRHPKRHALSHWMPPVSAESFQPKPRRFLPNGEVRFSQPCSRPCEAAGASEIVIHLICMQIRKNPYDFQILCHQPHRSSLSGGQAQRNSLYGSSQKSRPHRVFSPRLIDIDIVVGVVGSVCALLQWKASTTLRYPYWS